MNVLKVMNCEKRQLRGFYSFVKEPIGTELNGTKPASPERDILNGRPFSISE